MDAWVVAMMMGASMLLGALGLWALLWGIRSGQFDDKKKFIDGALFDSEEALNDAVMMERKKEAILKDKEEKKKAGYNPPD